MRLHVDEDELGVASGLPRPVVVEEKPWRRFRGKGGQVAYKEVMHLLAWVLGGACKLLRVFRGGLG